MEDKLVAEKPKLQQYLYLPVLENPKYRFRFLYCNVSENVITTDETYTHDKKSLWIPLYLASDIFAMDSFTKCNRFRVHAAFRKQGLATKLFFPRGMRLSGVPVSGDTGVCFYSVYGLIQAVMQYAKCQSEQITVLETLMDTWKLRVDDDKLPDRLSNLTLIHCDIVTAVPLPEDLKPTYSHDDYCRFKLPLTQPPRKDEQSSYVLSSGCVITRKNSTVLKVSNPPAEIPVSSKIPTVGHSNPKQGSKPPSEIPVSPKLPTVGHSNLKQGSCCETNLQQYGKCALHKTTHHCPSSSASEVNENVSCPDESAQNQGSDKLDKGKEMKQKVFGSHSTGKHKPVKRRACGHLKNTTSVKCLNEDHLHAKVKCLNEDHLHAKLKVFADNLKLVMREHSRCCLKECLYFLLEEFLRLEEDDDDQSEEITANKLWNSQSLICLSRWMGAKFRLLVPDVIKKVDNFKKANFDIIAELPSERQLISELFPPPMWELLIVWMGMTTSLSQKCGENSLDHCGSEEKIQKEHSLLLLLLEFANQALVSGVAHVLYPRFVSM